MYLRAHEYHNSFQWERALISWQRHNCKYVYIRSPLIGAFLFLKLIHLFTLQATFMRLYFTITTEGILMKTLKQKIEVMQAALDGKEIYFIPNPHNWTDCWELLDSDEEVWDWSNYDYRIKPEPMEFWVSFYNSIDDFEIFDTKEGAIMASKCCSNFTKTIKVREVIE